MKKKIMMIRVLLLLCIMPLGVYAACTDPAAANVDWQRCYFDGKDMNGIEIPKARIRETSFTRSNLEKANLEGVNAHRAKFNTSKLNGINFKGATITEADFTKAELNAANFENANLNGTKMVRAELKKANFKGAKLNGTDFRDALLGGAIWTDGRICAENSVGQCQ